MTELVAGPVERGVAGLRTGTGPDFPLAPQLADAAAALTVIDEPGAVALLRIVLVVDATPATMVAAVAAVARGRGEPAAAPAEELAARGDESVRDALRRAWQRQTRRRAGGGEDRP